MAWAIVDQNSDVIGVSLQKPTLQFGSKLFIWQISDQEANMVLQGRLQLHELLKSIAKSDRYADLSMRYPCLLLETEVDSLIELVKQIPHNGTAVETGSFGGGSAKVILDNAVNLKNLSCFDPEWADPKSPGMSSYYDDAWMMNFKTRWNFNRFKTCYAHAKWLLAPYSNVHLIPMSSPYDIYWWNEPIDFIFEDSSHHYPQIHDTLQFWVPLIKSGGLIAGHDYHSGWPDVMREVEQLRSHLGAELHVQGTLWWMRKP